MKKFRYIIAIVTALVLGSSCAKLDLNPLSQASSENWYSDADEIVISLNDLYRTYLYGMHVEYFTDRRTDDWAQRDQVYEFCNGSVTSTTSTFITYWENSYKGISRANRIIEAIDTRYADDPSMLPFKAEAAFFRAFLYGRMMLLWGDVPFYVGTLDLDEAFKMGRTSTSVIKEQVMKDFQFAIDNLPVDNHVKGIWRVNKNVALGIAARFCLNVKDWEKAADYAKQVIDSGAYSLYYSSTDPADSYGELFRDKTMNTEILWSIPYSYALETSQSIKSWVLRTAGGNNTAQPSWDLLAAYECTDGKPIDESPLFDCHDPYKNRDPRCCMTFVAPGTTIYGVVFNPEPSITTTLKDGEMVKNKDNKTQDQYAAYNSTCLRKGAQPEWRDPIYSENPWIMLRYADVLLMYAEAKCEMNSIDGSVLNAINDIRARAYGVKRGDTDKYPEITETDQTKLRRLIRKERRVELAWEGRRFFDLRRWGWLEKVYSIHYYGHLNATQIKKYYADGNWYWPETPDIDEDGFADFTKMFDKGLIQRYGLHVYDPKVELFPIPNEDIIINDNLVQNPGY